MVRGGENVKLEDLWEGGGKKGYESAVRFRRRRRFWHREVMAGLLQCGDGGGRAERGDGSADSTSAPPFVSSLAFL